MNRRAWFFFGFIVAGAALCLVTLREPVLAPRDALGLLTFVGLGVFAEGLALDFQLGANKQTKSSVSYIPIFACAITFPAAWTVLAGAAMIVLADLFVYKRRNWIPIFNASQYVISLFVATAVYSALRRGAFPASGFSLIAFFSLAFSYFSINIVIIASFFAIRSGRSLLGIIHETIGPTGSNLFYDVLASPIAVLAAWLYDQVHVGGVLLAILPLLLVRYSYLSALQFRQVNKDLIRVLIKAIETRDPYTSGHSVRVATLARMIGHELRLGRRRIDTIETAALLHDIGKIESLYAGIIGKPHELTASERAVIRTHATKGAEMLKELSAFQDEDIIDGVRHHHERYDGSGYPDGLRGTGIPLPARVIMLCDALDAMLSDRPYRSALDVDNVRRELVRCAGEQFDPEMVRVILERGTVERARELVQQQPPEAMAHPAIVAAAGGT